MPAPSQGDRRNSHVAHARRVVTGSVTALVWSLVLAGVCIGMGAMPARAADSPSSAASNCSDDVADRAARASGFVDRAERFWAARFGAAQFKVSAATCGHLAGRSGRDLVVVLHLVDGTGGSPKPWAILNRSRRGTLKLRYGNLGEKLICPGSMRVQRRKLLVHRPTEYLGAHSICDEVATFRWKGKTYRQVRVKPSWRWCQSPQRIDGEGGGFTAFHMRVSGLSCSRGWRLLRRGGRLPLWWCDLIGDTEVRCKHTRNVRRWLTYQTRYLGVG